jgi:hypothetical protein
MPGLYKIAAAEDRYDVSEALRNYALIMLKVPTNEKGAPSMTFHEFTEYYEHLVANMGNDSGIGVAGTPFEWQMVTLAKSGATNEVDTISRARDNFWSASGTPSIVHGGVNEHSSALKLAIKNDESYVDKIVRQVERWCNRYLRVELGGTLYCKTDILPTTQFNIDEYNARLKTSATMGIGKLHYAVSCGIKQADIVAASFLENTVLKVDELWKPLSNTYNTPSDATSGRPELSDDELGDAGEQTREDGGNEDKT